MLTSSPWLDLVLKAIVWGAAAYLGSYLAQKGQHRAMTEDLKKLLSRAQSEAEAKKRGETEAVQKDLYLILDQLRQTTELTKQIEADITYKALARICKMGEEKVRRARGFADWGIRVVSAPRPAHKRVNPPLCIPPEVTGSRRFAGRILWGKVK